MDESLQELEDELKRLRPARPSPALMARLEVEMAREVSPGDSRSPIQPAAAPTGRRWAWSLAAAAVIMVALVLRQMEPPATRTPDGGSAGDTAPANPAAVAGSGYHPVDASSVYYGATPESGVYLRNQTPVQEVRYRYIDTYTWKNPVTHASMQWSVPRDEIRVIPAVYH